MNFLVLNATIFNKENRSNSNQNLNSLTIRNPYEVTSKFEKSFKGNSKLNDKIKDLKLENK